MPFSPLQLASRHEEGVVAVPGELGAWIESGER